MAFSTVKTSAQYYPRNAQARGLVYSAINNLIKALAILDELNAGIKPGSAYYDLTVVKGVAEQYAALTGDGALYALSLQTTQETLPALVDAIEANNGFAAQTAAIIALWEIFYQTDIDVATNGQALGQTMAFFDNPLPMPPGWPVE